MTDPAPPPDAPRDILLNDLRVVDARGAILEVGDGAVANFAGRGGPMLHLVLSGAADFLSPSSPTAVRAEAGDSVLIFYGDPHRIAVGADQIREDQVVALQSAGMTPATIQLGASPSGATLLSVALELAYVSPSAFAHRAAADLWVLRRQPKVADEASALQLDLDQIRSGCSGAGSAAFIAALATLVYVHMVRDMRDRYWHDREVEVYTPKARRVATALREIHAHYDRDWTVAALARKVGFSRSTFADTFRKHVGVAPLAYVTEVRMRRAAELLEIDSITPQEVARRVGYSRASSFARTFKSRFGLSPRAFSGRTREAFNGQSGLAAPITISKGIRP